MSNKKPYEPPAIRLEYPAAGHCEACAYFERLPPESGFRNRCALLDVWDIEVPTSQVCEYWRGVSHEHE